MTWWLWILLSPFLLVGLLWAAYQVARRSPHRTFLIPRPIFRDHVEVRIYFSKWWGDLIPGNGIAFRREIWFDKAGRLPQGWTGPITPRRALLHELIHAVYQTERLGSGYLPTYLWHRFVLRRSWKDHMMEKEANRLSAHWMNGDRSIIGELPAELLYEYWA